MAFTVRLQIVALQVSCLIFFFNDTATTEIYTLSLHDALPIFAPRWLPGTPARSDTPRAGRRRDRKSTRLNSSHVSISYAVFCLKKKNKKERTNTMKKKKKKKSNTHTKKDKR